MFGQSKNQKTKVTPSNVEFAKAGLSLKVGCGIIVSASYSNEVTITIDDEKFKEDEVGDEIIEYINEEIGKLIAARDAKRSSLIDKAAEAVKNGKK